MHTWMHIAQYTGPEAARRMHQVYGVHCKRLAVFPSPAGMSLTKLSLDGKTANLFLQCTGTAWIRSWVRWTYSRTSHFADIMKDNIEILDLKLKVIWYSIIFSMQVAVDVFTYVDKKPVRKAQSRLFWSFHAVVLNIRSLDLSLTLGRPFIISLFFPLCISSHHGRLTAIVWSEWSLPSGLIHWLKYH